MSRHAGPLTGASGWPSRRMPGAAATAGLRIGPGVLPAVAAHRPDLRTEASRAGAFPRLRRTRKPGRVRIDSRECETPSADGPCGQVAKSGPGKAAATTTLRRKERNALARNHGAVEFSSGNGGPGSGHSGTTGRIITHSRAGPGPSRPAFPGKARPRCAVPRRTPATPPAVAVAAARIRVTGRGPLDSRQTPAATL